MDSIEDALPLSACTCYPDIGTIHEGWGRLPKGTGSRKRVMTQQDAFLQDILEHPEDDGRRRVYADWLLDHPDPVAAGAGS